jgi:hypothetical protein
LALPVLLAESSFSSDRRLTVHVLVLVFTLAVGIVTTAWKSSRIETPRDREAEEYAVYSGLINSFPGVGLLLVANQTISAMPQEAEVNESEFFKLHVPDTIARETFEDYKVRERQSLLLANRLTVGRTYMLISNQEAKSYFENSASRARLVEKYPNSSGRITMLSRVGFNKKMDEALVYAWGYCGGDCGGGGYYVLRREDGVWRVKDKKLYIS